MKMPRTSAFSTAIRSSNELIHLDPVNCQSLTSVTVGLNHLYRNSKYGRPKHGRGKTDEKGKYHPCPGEILARRYKILQILSKQGQSGIILKAQDLYTQTEVTIKVLHVKYYGIGIQEAHLLSTLKSADPYHVSRTVRLLATFKHKVHYCMVFESLHPEPITEVPCFIQAADVTQKLTAIRKLTVRLLQVLSFLQQQNMIHADLKPENILLKDKNDIDSIRVIDFGNAIHHVHQEVSMYYEKFELQTLLYRAPEVMFGIPFGCEVDMWSLGCILVELFLGTPLFLGENKTELIIEIVDILGPLPTEIFQRGKFYKELSQFTSKHTIKDATLEILNQLTDCYDYIFANFLSGLLKLNPDDRLTPLSALQHPFIAPEFNMGMVLQSQGSKDSMFVLRPENYTERPKVSPDIKRQNPTSYDLLQLGTTSESCHNIAVVCPFSKSKQGRVSVVPQVSAIPPFLEISNPRQSVSSVPSSSSVQNERPPSSWNSASLRVPHVPRNRIVGNAMNSRRNARQQDLTSAGSDRIFTNIQHKQRQHNLQTLAHVGPPDNLQSPVQNVLASPVPDVYAYSIEGQSSSDGDPTTVSPRKIRRVSGHINCLDPRLQNPHDPRGDSEQRTPFVLSQSSSLANTRPFQRNESRSSELDIGETRTRSSAGIIPTKPCTTNPRVQRNFIESEDLVEVEPAMVVLPAKSTRKRQSAGTNLHCSLNQRQLQNSLESEDVIQVEPTRILAQTQISTNTNPENIEQINISDQEDTEWNNPGMLPGDTASSNPNDICNSLPIRTRSVSRDVILEEENIHDVTIVAEEEEISDERVKELVDGNIIQSSFDNRQACSLLNKKSIVRHKCSTDIILPSTSTPISGCVRPCSLPKKHVSSEQMPTTNLTNRILSPLCSTEEPDSALNVPKRKSLNEPSNSLCPNELDTTIQYPENVKVLSNKPTSVQTPLCSSSVQFHESYHKSTSSCHNPAHSKTDSTLQSDKDISEFENIYSSLVQNDSTPNSQPLTPSSGTSHIRTYSSLKRKKARDRCASGPCENAHPSELLIKTDSASRASDPEKLSANASTDFDLTDTVIKEELPDDYSIFQEPSQGSTKSPRNRKFLSPLQHEIKTETGGSEFQSNTSVGHQILPNRVEHNIKADVKIKKEPMVDGYQDTTVRGSASSVDAVLEKKYIVMKVKTEIKMEPDSNSLDHVLAPVRDIKLENENKSECLSAICSESPTSRVLPMPRKSNLVGPQLTSLSENKEDLEIKVELSTNNNNVLQRSDVSSRRSRASSKALEPNFVGSSTPLAMEIDVNTSSSKLPQYKAIRKSLTKVAAETFQFPSPSSPRVSQSPRRLSRALESEEHSEITASPRVITLNQSPAKIRSSSTRQFNPRVIASDHGFDSPLLPGREDSSSPESVVFSPQKLKRIENGTIYFEGFDKYISRRELSEKVIKILPETKPKPQRVYSSTESDLSESTASYIRKNSKRVQLPRRTQSKITKQHGNLTHGYQTVASDGYKATATDVTSSAGKKTNKAACQYKEFTESIATKQKRPSDQKVTKRRVQNRAAVKRILKRWKVRNDSAATDNSSHRHTPPNSEIIPSEMHLTERGNEQELFEDAPVKLVDEENLPESAAATPSDSGLTPHLQEYSWTLLDRDAQKQVLEKEWSQIARANNFFGSRSPHHTKRSGNFQSSTPCYEESKDLRDVQKIEEEEDDQLTVYSPSQTSVISLTPHTNSVSPYSPLRNIEIHRNLGKTANNTTQVEAEIRSLLNKGFELRPVSKPSASSTPSTEYATSSPQLRICDSIPYSPTQSPFSITSASDLNERTIPMDHHLNSPRSQRRLKYRSQNFVDSGVGQSTSPKLSIKFKKPKSFMSNIKQRYRAKETKDSESDGYSDLTVSEISSSPDYSFSTSSSTSLLRSSELDVAYSPTQEPVLTSSPNSNRKRKIRRKPQIRVTALNTRSTNETSHQSDPNNSRNHRNRIRDDDGVEPDVLGNLGQTVPPERHYGRNLRRRDMIPRLDRSDPNVALYGAFVYSAKKLS